MVKQFLIKLYLIQPLKYLKKQKRKTDDSPLFMSDNGKHKTKLFFKVANDINI